MKLIITYIKLYAQMMNRDDYITQIIDALAILATKVELNNTINLTSINIHCENFYKDLLNLALGYNLENINTTKANAKAIDLGDKIKKIAIQVTSTSSLAKTKKTVKNFIEEKHYDTYHRLVIFNICSKINHKDEWVGDQDTFRLNTKADIWDKKDFVKKISDKKTDELYEIVQFLNRELKLTPSIQVPKEVQTIIGIIDHLSNQNSKTNGDTFLKNPDPEGKIHKRFHNYSKFLEKLYTDLYTTYGNLLKTAEEESDIGIVQIRKQSIYLQFHSDDILTTCNGDAKEAMDILTHEFADALKQKKIDYDETAIRFYIVNQFKYLHQRWRFETLRLNRSKR